MLSLQLVADALKGEEPDEREIAREAVVLGALLIRKGRDYGHSVAGPPVLCPHLDGETAILVRMSDKIKRLQSLSDGTKAQIADESFDDTLRDLAGYCLLLRKLRGTDTEEVAG